jgi:hypothetical protein
LQYAGAQTVHSLFSFGIDEWPNTFHITCRSW